jgi:hypothetical protein
MVHKENRNISSSIKLLIDERRFEWGLNRPIGVISEADDGDVIYLIR